MHRGGEANEFKSRDKIDWTAGEDGYLDTSFSKDYPEYVSGTGMTAEVNVSDEKLQQHVKSSLELVRWLAEELRPREIAALQGTNGQIL